MNGSIRPPQQPGHREGDQREDRLLQAGYRSGADLAGKPDGHEDAPEREEPEVHHRVGVGVGGFGGPQRDDHPGHAG